MNNEDTLSVIRNSLSFAELQKLCEADDKIEEFETRCFGMENKEGTETIELVNLDGHKVTARADKDREGSFLFSLDIESMDIHIEKRIMNVEHEIFNRTRVRDYLECSARGTWKDSYERLNNILSPEQELEEFYNNTPSDETRELVAKYTERLKKETAEDNKKYA